jgi:excisionase family DNA binding protein
MLDEMISERESELSIPSLQPLLTYNEAADILAVKPQTLRQWVSTKRIPYVKIGSAVRSDSDRISWKSLSALHRGDRYEQRTAVRPRPLDK